MKQESLTKIYLNCFKFYFNFSLKPYKKVLVFGKYRQFWTEPKINDIEISFFWLVGYFDKAADTQRMTTYIDLGSKIFKNVCLLDGLIKHPQF